MKGLIEEGAFLMYFSKNHDINNGKIKSRYNIYLDTIYLIKHNPVCLNQSWTGATSQQWKVVFAVVVEYILG